MKKLSRSIEEYLAAGGWSSKLFIEHAKYLFNDPDVSQMCQIDVGRSVIHIKSNGKLLRVYVHYQGRSHEYLTLVTEDGVELQTFHHSVDPLVIKQQLFEYFECQTPPQTNSTQ